MTKLSAVPKDRSVAQAAVLSNAAASRTYFFLFLSTALMLCAIGTRSMHRHYPSSPLMAASIIAISAPAASAATTGTNNVDVAMADITPCVEDFLIENNPSAILKTAK